jgi:hypothetical protein
MSSHKHSQLLGLAVLASVVTMGAPLMAQVSREQVREELLTTIEHASAR